MKHNTSIKPKSACLTAAALLMLACMAVQAAAPTSLKGRLIARPLTPGNIETLAGNPNSYGLSPYLEVSAGITTIGVGTPVYLEADVSLGIPPSQITNLQFVITSKPISSAAAITNCPFGTNVGVYEPADQLVYEVAGRAMLRPDQPGTYTVTATIGSTTLGSTNVSYTITAGSYLGASPVCEYCHDGSPGVTNEYQYWTNTSHASMFANGINGILSSHYGASCEKCHTVGYDTNASALADNGFYSAATAAGWSFPKTLSPTNWGYMQSNYPSVANLANIQCENCHGPGSQHLDGAGATNAITVTVFTGDCTQCHDSPNTEADGTQWYVSRHAQTTTTPSGTGRDQCVQCHTAYGFITRIQNAQVTNQTSFPATNTTYAAIGCQTCHEPHGNTVPMGNQNLIRVLTPVTLGDGTIITNAGLAELCLECHHSRNGSASNVVANWPKGIPVWPGATEPPSANDFGPHDGPQGDMIEGANAITYGLAIPSSAHHASVSNLCVGCHMQTIATTDPGFLLSGGHSFEMSYNMVTNGVTNVVDQTAVCTQCHGPLSSFDFPVTDNNGAIVGIQTEVQGLLNQLSTLLPNSKGIVTGLVTNRLSPTTNWTQAQLNAAYNWEFVNNDGSLGVHNANFAVGLLQASIANLTGISTPGGLPDSWEIQYFGSTSNPEGAPDADPAGDGIPNWLKYALGLNPTNAGLAVPNGVVYANGGSLGGNSSSNSIEIFTAAQITFNTVAGTSYQIQEIDDLSGAWKNVGPAILATNTGSMSYLTPTQGINAQGAPVSVQQFFRVVSTP